MYEWILEIGRGFSAEDYMYWTRIQGTAWTLADFVLVLFLTRICNLFRYIVKAKPHRIPYAILAATAPFALFIPVAPHGEAFFRIELVVTIPHFLIILYLFIANRNTVLRGFRALLQTPPADSPNTKSAQA